MEMYYIRNKKTGKNFGSGYTERWMPTVTMLTAKGLCVGAITIDTACAAYILNSNMKKGFKFVSVTALGARILDNCKGLAKLCNNYEVTMKDITNEDDETPVEDLNETESEQNPEEKS